MNTRNWSIQKAIQDRVQKEDLYLWGQSKSRNEIPKQEIKKVLKKSLKLVFLNSVMMFRP